MFYLIYDPDPKRFFTKQVYSTKEAQKWNAKNFGVFVTPNKFRGARLTKNLEKIRFCFFEIDSISKKEQRERIAASPLLPSIIIESYSSYHVYFRLRNNLDMDRFKLIQKGIIKHFGSDPKVRDVTRLMRAPNFYHCKNPNGRFLVKKILDEKISYTGEELSKAFPYEEKPYVPQRKPVRELTESDKSFLSDISPRAKVENLNARKALEALSGTPYVNCEIYNFRRNSNGNLNIIVNGEQTACFIDKEGMIGATHGPTVWQWLRYFGHSESDIGRIINNVFGV